MEPLFVIALVGLGVVTTCHAGEEPMEPLFVVGLATLVVLPACLSGGTPTEHLLLPVLATLSVLAMSVGCGASLNSTLMLVFIVVLGFVIFRSWLAYEPLEALPPLNGVYTSSLCGFVHMSRRTRSAKGVAESRDAAVAKCRALATQSLGGEIAEADLPKIEELLFANLRYLENRPLIVVSGDLRHRAVILLRKRLGNDFAVFHVLE